MARNHSDSEAQGAPPASEAPQGKHAREDYAGHLARVTPDADRNKALLQARYRALHDVDPDHPDSH